jgi:hypothetical protein
MKRGVKPPPLKRWSLDEAAREFACAVKDLSLWLRRAEIAAGADGYYSTLQLVRAVHGDYDSERLREVKHRANLLELEEREKRRQLIPADQVAAAWEAVLAGLRSGVMNSELDEQKKRDLLDDLRQIPVGEYYKTPVSQEIDE